MKNFLYPTEAQIDIAVKWCNHGPGSLDPGTVTDGVRVPSPHRPRSLSVLGELLRRMDLHDDFDWMRRKAFKKDLALHLDDRILSAVLRSLRYHGYVYRVGPVPEGARRPMHFRTPMTGRELHIVRLLSRGMSSFEIGTELGVNSNSVAGRLYDIRARFDVDTTAELVAMTYENEWMPTRVERRRLDSLSGGPVTWPGYIRVDVDESEVAS